MKIKHTKFGECESAQTICGIIGKVGALVDAITALVHEQTTGRRLVNWQLRQQVETNVECTKGYAGKCDEKCTDNKCTKEHNGCAETPCNIKCETGRCRKESDELCC
jgi:hypothetical protein